MNEAPFSYNIKVISPTGFDEQFTIRGEEPQNFLAQVTRLKTWLTANGYGPTRPGPTRPVTAAPMANGNGNGNGNGASNAAICKWHGPMKASTQAPGTFYCPSRMGDDSYCKETA